MSDPEGWPKDYIVRKLDILARVGSLGEGDAADCARALWELLVECEGIAERYKRSAIDASSAIQSLDAALDRVRDAMRDVRQIKKITRRRR